MRVDRAQVDNDINRAGERVTYGLNVSESLGEVGINASSANAHCVCGLADGFSAKAVSKRSVGVM